MLFRSFILDASYDHDTDITGIGLAVHESNNPRKNRNGILISEIMEAYHDIPSYHGEMLAVYRALEIAKDRGYTNIRTRSDYNYMRKALKKSYENKAGANRDDLHGEIMRLSSLFDQVHFGFKPRRKNQMAHILARRARTEVVPITREELSALCHQKVANKNIKPTQKDARLI